MIMIILVLIFRTFGTVATSRCDDGYDLVSGDEERTCGGDGKWNGENLVCERFGRLTKWNIIRTSK